MQRLYNGHLIAMIIFFFMGMVHRRSLQVVMTNIEVTGFDPVAFDSPTYTFGIRSLFFCAMTILVGYRTWRRMPLTGGFLLTGGVLFFILGFIMVLRPRFMNIIDAFPLWCGYITGAIVLTIIGVLYYESSTAVEHYYDDDILDAL